MLGKVELNLLPSPTSPDQLVPSPRLQRDDSVYMYVCV